jgi:hypothetical protein
LNGYSESINKRRTDNTLTKRKEVIVLSVDLGGIYYHCCLEVIVFLLILGELMTIAA